MAEVLSQTTPVGSISKQSSPSTIRGSPNPQSSHTGETGDAIEGVTTASSSKSEPTSSHAPSAQPNNTMSQVAPTIATQGKNDSQTAIDPLSRHILKRTNTENLIPQKLRAGVPNETDPGASEGPPAPQFGSRSPVQPTALGRDAPNRSMKDGKDKKKGVSFLSRFIGSKKKEPSPDIHEDELEAPDTRTEGMDADVFSQPIGFIPRFPAPPKYIKVRVHNRKDKDFDRVFLAQEIHGRSAASRKHMKEKSPTATITETLPAGSKNNCAIWAMEFSKDGRYLAAGGQDKIVRVWAVLSSPEDRLAHETEEDAKDEDEPAVRLNAPVFKTKPVQEYEGHTASVLDLSWSKNNFLLSSSMDKTVRLWHVSRNECLCCFKHSDFVTSIQFHPRDDRFFLAGSLDSKLRLWSIPDKSVAFWTHVADMVTAVTFTPDGKTAVAGCLNGLCMFYETEGLKPYTQIHVRSARGKNARGSKITGMDTITLPPDDPNGVVKLLITSNDSRVRLYNFRDRNLEVKFRGNENTCSQIHATFSDDGRYVICGSEDRKAYIWPTAHEDKEQDKRPVEVFEAHSAIVTTAILAPTKTRHLLGGSGDPLYDLCNPPPVTLVERTGSLPSSKPPTENGAGHQDSGVPPTPRTNASKPEESPAYVARSSHVNGNIIVTADYTGTIKVFRQDCAYQKRRHESWDNSSTISKKFLGRSGSVATRNSMSSVSKRDSLHKQPSADRILSWRQSIASGNNGSRDSLRNGSGVRTRSVSPHKSIGQTSHQSSPQQSSSQSNNASSVAVTSPPPPTPHQPLGNLTLPQPQFQPQSQPQSDTAAKQNGSRNNSEAAYIALPMRKDDPLMLQGDQSYMYWNRATYSAQASTMPRTPGLLEPNSYMTLSRKQSIVSTLSSEVSSAEEPAGDASEGEDLKCAACGSTSFRAKGKAGEQTLVCNNCGTVAS